MLSFTDEMHKTTNYSLFNYNREKTASSFKSIIDRNQFIYITDGCLMIGTADETFFGNSVVANDCLIYVKKEHRGRGLSKLALNKFIEWAKEVGADSIMIGQSSGVNNEEFASAAISCGFKKLGEVFAR
tara:strand:- start:3910 stop:4296 length:387 start_codon:yes stop_codon:yes gene_type:complete